MNNVSDMDERIRPDEQDEKTHPFLPPSATMVDSVGHGVESAVAQAGDYRSPTGVRERLLANLYQKLRVDFEHVLGEEPVLLQSPHYPIHKEWQILLQYLYAEGILQHPFVTFDPLYHDDPKIFSIRLTAAPSPTDGGAVISSGKYSRGVSYNFDEALSKVVGELLERYPLSLFRKKEFVRASIASLRKRKLHFLDPFLVDQFSERQKELLPSRRFDEQSVFYFAKGRSLTNGSDALIPAQMIYFNYRFDDDEPIIREANTNGAGGMFTYEEAVLSGLLELIQRDGFLLHWLSNTPPRRIDPSSLTSTEIHTCLQNIERYHLEPVILDVTSDIGVPAFVTILLDRSGVGPAVVLGGGCGFDQESAILRGLTEVIGVRGWLRAMRDSQGDRALPSADGIEPFTVEWGTNNRLLLWYDVASIDRIQRFTSSAPVMLDHSKDRQFANPRDELAFLIELFTKRGAPYEIFVFHADHSALRTLGYHSVKVCVPALLPLYLNEINAPLTASRLSERLHNRPVNPFPHPFP